MSSSAIGFQNISYGITGATGPVGPTGATGPDGLNIGATGPIGPYAPYVRDILVSGTTATVILSDNTTYAISGNFSGTTAIDYTYISNVGGGTYSILSSGNNTSSFIMRGLSAYGSLVITEDAEAIYINSIYTPSSGTLDSLGLADNTLVYLKQNNQISSTTIGVTSGSFYDGTLNFEKSGSTPSSPKFSKILPRSKVKYIPPTYNTGSTNPVVLNVNDAGVFYIRTPNGISAFDGTFKPSEVVSFTLITESDDIWNFPSNVYFENGENYLTCGKSILNLSSFDQGASWYAVVAARGVDVDAASCKVRSLYGSCCYNGVTGQMCLDYATKAQCDILSGTFNPLQSCNFACGSTLGICCSNGQCISNTSYAECLAFGGNFLRGVTCGSYGANTSPTATNETRLCYDACQTQRIACCKDGICLGDKMTKIECEKIHGGIAFVDKTCNEVDCCSQNIKIGACCKNQSCSQKTLIDCKNSGGVFMGEGELCENVNCGCIGSARYGTCCYCNTTTATRNCKITAEGGCPDGVWTYDPNATSTTSACSPQQFTICSNLPSTALDCTIGTGRCCFCDPDTNTTDCITFTTPSRCAQLRGRFTVGVQSCTPACDPCTSNNGSPCQDCVPAAVPGIACKCSAVGSEPNCIPVNDINTECPPGYQCSASSTSCNANPCNCAPPGECLIRPEFDNTANCPQINVLTSGSQDYSFLYEKTSSIVSTTSSSITPTGLNLSFNTHAGVLVKDYYIDITGAGFHKSADGKDLKFCFSLNLQALRNAHSTTLPSGEIVTDLTDNSVRVYLLRTWYPKFFAQNYAAYKQFKYKENFDQNSTVAVNVPFNSDSTARSDTEQPYWSFLTQFEDRNISYYDILNSYIDNTGFPALNHYLNPNSLRNYKTDDLRMNLNCPLYGFNTRGKATFNYNGSSSLSDGSWTSSATVAGILNANASTTSDGNHYPGPFEYTHPRYYHSTDLGIRYCTDPIGSNLPATMIYPEIYKNILIRTPSQAGLTYISISGGILKSTYMLMSKTIPQGQFSNSFAPYSVDFGDPQRTLNTYRFNGYTDFGISTNIPGVTTKTYLSNTHVGDYITHALLNNFANSGTLHSGLEAHINTINVGHPLTMDYEGDFVTLQGEVKPFYTSQTRDDSPLKKTNPSAIILDSGVITKFGNKIIQQTYVGQDGKRSYLNLPVKYIDQQYFGAINDPLLRSTHTANPSTPDVEEAVTIGKYFTDDQTYNFCVTLKNYKNYVLTPEEAADQTEALLFDEVGFDVDVKKRFTNYINKLRLVVFVNAHEPSMVGITYSNENLLDATSTKSIKAFGENYLNYQIKTDLTTPNIVDKMSYVLNFGDSTLCSAAHPITTQGCPLCDLQNNDYESNCYTLLSSSDICRFVFEYPCNRDIFTRKYFPGNGTGLGSFKKCCCNPNQDCPTTWYSMCSCGSSTLCSCKGETIHVIQPDTCTANQCTGADIAWADICRSCDLVNLNLNFSRWLAANNIIGRYDSATDRWALKHVKLPNMFGLTNHTSDGRYIYNKSYMCDGRFGQTNVTNIEYIDWSSPCFKDYCIYNNSTCNKGSLEPGQDLTKILQLPGITLTFDSACNGFNLSNLLGRFQEGPLGSCPSTFMGDSIQNKKIFLNEVDFICVPLDCGAIDCSTYEDCIP